MKTANDYFVYILANRLKCWWYVGLTTDIKAHITQDIRRASGAQPFYKKYFSTYIIYYEYCPSMGAAIERTKALNAMSRTEKAAFIRQKNPEFKFIYESYMLLSQKSTQKFTP